ncbi:MAG: [protein-PII] uridylyltransferase [Ignavibacteriales bacterium CG_4_9_14_3_um_filter_34_10]|nr:MAG: [protein-PII] uridylyltransferase [Ignavibacteriales bacterium CG_4_9_14_3_um_filter_34_10]
MPDSITIKNNFLAAREELFSNSSLIKNSFEFCVQYSLLVEEFIYRSIKKLEGSIVLASSGSFSRRELSPYSDIDVMFIVESLDNYKDIIQSTVTYLWDCGLEVSHTVRDFNDIEDIEKNDLQSLTQFFETRYIIGSRQTYKKWNTAVVSLFDDQTKHSQINNLISDIKNRHHKYGTSPKVLEPNVKFSSGGLRDLHSLEWIYCLVGKSLINSQHEITQTEIFIKKLRDENFLSDSGAQRLITSYQFILSVRNHLHLLHRRKVDRLEFSDQEMIFASFDFKNVNIFMMKYFESSNVINRFCWTMLKSYEESISNPLPSDLSIKLDDDYNLKGRVISLAVNRSLNLSEMLRAFYYRGIHDARFDRELRTQIIESVFEANNFNISENSSVFFREILKLPQNVGKILYVMNELGVLGAYLPEFKELIGFFQPGVYHCYTADEHTLIALKNLEEIESSENQLGVIFNSIKRKDILFLAVLLHDIAKPLSISGHEILGSEISASIMDKLGYNQSEIEQVRFLVFHHLIMEQTAFRRNIYDAVTLNNFAALFPSIELLDMLYLITYSDLSAVNPMVWTNWKSELLFQLYRKTRLMLEEKISAEDLLYSDVQKALNDMDVASDESIKNHIESFNDYSYIHSFSTEEINSHIQEIERGLNVSVSFSENKGATLITVITKDSPSLLSKLCGAVSINDLNIHTAKIFTRKDGIVIDTFSVTDYRTNKKVESIKHKKIITDIELAVSNQLAIGIEFNNVRNKWWRFENKLFRRRSKIKIKFEDHDKYTIIDVYSPDCLGLLYQITRKLNEIGLSIYFAKIATKSDDVVDAFYVLDYNSNKISSDRYELISVELTKSIEELL